MAISHTTYDMSLYAMQLQSNYLTSAYMRVYTDEVKSTAAPSIIAARPLPASLQAGYIHRSV